MLLLLRCCGFWLLRQTAKQLSADKAAQTGADVGDPRDPSNANADADASDLREPCSSRW